MGDQAVESVFLYKNAETPHAINYATKGTLNNIENYSWT